MPLVLSALLLAGCATTPATEAPSARPPRLDAPGLSRVMHRTAADLVALFGDADLDQREGAARRMQFAGPACVLDAYLTAERPGAEPVVTYIDARLTDGDDIDRASCIAALSRRDSAR